MVVAAFGSASKDTLAADLRPRIVKGRRLRPAPFADTLPGTEALLYAPRMSWRSELKLADLPKH